MADVDFTNAVLDANPDGTWYPLTLSDYLGFARTASLYNSGAVNIAYNNSVSIITDTPSKASILFTGTFDRGGTEFYMVDSGNRPWKVSNISFSGGDTYSFIIDVEVIGNT